MLVLGGVIDHNGTTLSALSRKLVQAIFKNALLTSSKAECQRHDMSTIEILIVRFQNTMLAMLISYENRTRPKALKLSSCQFLF